MNKVLAPTRSLTLVLAIIAALVVPWWLHSASSFAAGAKPSLLPLEAATQIAGGACAIGPACPATVGHHALASGLHMDISSPVAFALDGQYTTLFGTVYVDDSDTYSSSCCGSSREITLLDATDPTNPATLLRETFAPGTPIHIAVRVASVQTLSIQLSGALYNTSGNMVADMVALLSVAPVQGPPGRPVALLPQPYARAQNLAHFTWKPWPGAAGYYLQAWLVTPRAGQPVGGTQAVQSGETTTNSYDLALHGLSVGLWHWRVAAVNSAGSIISAWSAERAVMLG